MQKKETDDIEKREEREDAKTQVGMKKKVGKSEVDAKRKKNVMRNCSG